MGLIKLWELRWDTHSFTAGQPHGEEERKAWFCDRVLHPRLAADPENHRKVFVPKRSLLFTLLASSEISQTVLLPSPNHEAYCHFNTDGLCWWHLLKWWHGWGCGKKSKGFGVGMSGLSPLTLTLSKCWFLIFGGGLWYLFAELVCRLDNASEIQSLVYCMCLRNGNFLHVYHCFIFYMFSFSFFYFYCCLCLF